MIDYGLFRFASPPRTGTTWFRKACLACGLGDPGRTGVHEPHEDEPTSILRVSLVRHPADWLRSYWSSIHPGVIGVSAVDSFRHLGREGGFDRFVRECLQFAPGQVGLMVERYNADTVLRLEDMPWALIELLESLGVPESKSRRCLSLGPQNTSSSGLLPAWSAVLRRRVMAAEEELAERFDYF